MGWGGARPGAGRKPGKQFVTEEQKEAIKQMNASIAARLPELVGLLFDMAAGLKVATKDGQTAYRVAPNKDAVEYLINRLAGRPTEVVDADVQEAVEIVVRRVAERQE